MPRRNNLTNNLVLNGNFEFPSYAFTAEQSSNGAFINGTATGKAVYASGDWFMKKSAGVATAKYDTSVKKSGSASLKLHIDQGQYLEVYSNGSKGTSLITSLGNDTVRVSPGDVLRISFWLKLENMTGDSSLGANVTVFASDKDGTFISSLPSTSYKANTNWVFVSSTVTIPANSVFASIACLFYGHTGAGTLAGDAWFDDVQVTRLNDYGRKSLTNMVPNGNFENYPTFTAVQTEANWINGTSAGSAIDTSKRWAFVGGTAGSEASFDTSVKSSGSASLKISTKSAGALSVARNHLSSGVVLPTETPLLIPCKPNTTYSFSYKMKTNKVSGDANLGAFVLFSGIGINGGVSLVNSTPIYVKETTDWTQYSGTIVTTASSYFIRITLGIYGNNGTATLILDSWFDDITLAESTTGRAIVQKTQNLFVDSNTATNKGPTNLTLANDATVLDPFTSASTIRMTDTVDGSAVQHVIQQASADPDFTRLTPGTKWNASVYVKAATVSKVMFAPLNSAGSYHGFFFDLAANSSVAYSATNPNLAFNPRIEDVSGGWKRLSIDCVSPNPGETFFPRMYVWLATSTASLTYQGDGTGYVNLFGFQISQGWGVKPLVVTTSTKYDVGSPRSLNPMGQNLISQSNSFSDSVWVKRGTFALTPNAIANPVNGQVDAWRVDGLYAAALGDIYRFGNTLSNGNYNIWMKRISTTGIITFQDANSVNNGSMTINLATGIITFQDANSVNNGSMTINLATMGDEWQLITPTNPLVTLVNPFRNVVNSGPQITSDTAGTSVYIYNCQYNQGPYPGPTTVTGATAVNNGAPRRAYL